MPYIEYIQNANITKLRLFNDDEKYYLLAVYEVHNEDGSVDEITFPKIDLVAKQGPITIRHRYPEETYGTEIAIGCDKFHALNDVKYTIKPGDIRLCTHFIKRIKEPDPVEMTLEEIESKLGKKIKIVTKPKGRSKK